MTPMRFSILWFGLACVAAVACDVETQKGVTGATGPVVEVVDFVGFTPESLAVASGSTVTWGWFANNTYQHNVTFDTDTTLQSPLLRAGQYPVTFTHSGTYRYHCTVHGEKGVVTVQ